jgi:hypothetical protein
MDVGYLTGNMQGIGMIPKLGYITCRVGTITLSGEGLSMWMHWLENQRILT